MRVIAALFGLATSLAAVAADVPAPLEPWRAWVLHGQAFRACPLVAGHDAAGEGDFLCAWPGTLAVRVDDGGATVAQRWRVDAEAWIPLPGDAEHWPQQVLVDGQPAPVVDHDGPSLRLAPGSHDVRARIPWSERPQTLRVPEAVGLVALEIDGKPVSPVQRDGAELTLGRAAAATPEADSLHVRVHRRLEDGIPAQLTTRIEFAVSGQAREETIGPALPEGFEPLSITSAWPARLEADGRVRVRVQPGTATVTIEARALAPLAEAVARLPAEPWPQQEIWSYAAAPLLRVSVAAGDLPVDAAQAQVPAEWAMLPAFALEDDARLRIEERSRGQDPDAHNRLRLDREMWLDFDGGGWFARDRIHGEMVHGWRFDVAAPYSLQRAEGGGDALLVTRGDAPGTTGVEWRSGNVDLSAGVRVEGATTALPVTGWRSDFDGVSATVHLPDGYRLLAAPGADAAHGSWVARWTLYDIFIAALIALLAWRAFGLAGVAAALAYILLAYHESGAPRWLLLGAIGVALVLRALPPGRLADGVEWLRRVVLALLVLVALPFAAAQLRYALHPQLENDAADRGFAEQAFGDGVPRPVAQEVAADAAGMPQPAPAPAAPPPPPRKAMEKTRLGGMLASSTPTARQRVQRYYGESTVLQTGAGEPAWQRGASYRLDWSGRIRPDQTVQLWIAPSWAVRILRVALVALLAWLMWRLLQPALRPRVPGARVASWLLLAAPALGVAFGAAGVARAQAFPPADLLDQLRERAIEAPRCVPDCAAIAQAGIVARGDEVTLRLEAHALERVALPLPVDREALDLRRVTLDGVAADGLAAADGVLLLALPRGVHRIELAFVAVADKVSLEFPLPPARIHFDGVGWDASGIDDDRLMASTLSLARARAAGEATSDGAQQFAPYVRVERTIELGLDWSVDTRVVRLAPAEGGMAVALPLLPGEHVTSAGMKVSDGRVVVAFDADAAATGWQGTLDKADSIELVAPPLGERAETWIVRVGPSWHLEHAGVPVTALPPQEARGQHRQVFRPLPGERLVLQVSRPTPAQGASRAIDAVRLVRSTGQRASTVVLGLRVRASQGGEHAITLPAGAELVGSSRDGQPLNLHAQGGRVSLPLVPGTHEFELRWREDEPVALVTATPAISLGLPAANIDLGIDLPQDRWLLATSGPASGPAVLYWSELAVALLLAFALGRLRRSPLRSWQWLLLTLGFSTFSWVALLIVVAWRFALGWRAHSAPRGAVAFNLVQVGLPLLTLVAVACLLLAVQDGLLGLPDMAVAGNGSGAHALRWFADRSADAVPVAHAISLPLWVHKLAMLAWALWLAVALVGWLRSGLAAWTQGGWWRGRQKPLVDAPPSPPEMPS